MKQRAKTSLFTLEYFAPGFSSVGQPPCMNVAAVLAQRIIVYKIKHFPRP